MNTNDLNQGVDKSLLSNVITTNANYLSTQTQSRVTTAGDEGIEIGGGNDQQQQEHEDNLHLTQLPSLTTNQTSDGHELLTKNIPKLTKSRIVAKHSRGHEEEPSRIILFFGRILQKLRPYMNYVTKLYTVILANTLLISLLLIISRFTQSELFGITLLQSSSPPLLIAANVTMMISYSVQSYFWFRICLSCGM